MEYKKDVSDLKNNLLQTILDAIPDFISLQDNQGRYISVNKAFCEVIKKNRENVVGRMNDDLFPKAMAELYDKEDNDVLETGIPLAKENRLNRQETLKWLHVLKVPVFEKTGRVSGIVCSGRDITHLKEVQAQLTHAQKMESVGRLAAGVAHEINTPLGIILGYAQLLLEDVEKDGPVYQDVTTIVNQTRICSKIVSDLLKFSRSSERKITVFNINDAMEEVLGVVEHSFELQHVRVKREYDKNPLLIRGDKEKLKQVFVNLLNNAFDAIGERGSIRVKTGHGDGRGEVKISISDSGKGIPKESIGKIFEPFYTTKSPEKGTGLGLSVTFGIIKEHSGSIKAFSPPISNTEEEQGSQFVVVLPKGL